LLIIDPLIAKQNAHKPFLSLPAQPLSSSHKTKHNPRNRRIILRAAEFNNERIKNYFAIPYPS
jgi:hypothetical protein